MIKKVGENLKKIKITTGNGIMNIIKSQLMSKLIKH